jgi:AcrR family transcriptional regulator
MARTRSAAAHDKAFDAALTLFTERGIDATSMDSIAELSGVSKATLYKHWKDKDTLALEVLELLFGFREKPPKFDSGDLRKDLIDALNYQPAADRQAMKTRVLPLVLVYASQHPEFGNAWRARALGTPQLRLKGLLERGIRERVLKKNTDVEVGAALLLGPMLYWHIVLGNRSAKPVPPGWAEQVVDSFWRAHAR